MLEMNFRARAKTKRPRKCNDGGCLQLNVAAQPAKLCCSLSPGLTWVPVGIYLDLEEIRVFHVIVTG